jgi:hypothetical protein
VGVPESEVIRRVLESNTPSVSQAPTFFVRPRLQKSIPRMIRTLALALVFGTTVLFSSLYAYATDHDESTGKAIDLSGVGHCSGRTLNVTSAWSWTQYPSSPSVTEVTEVPDGFVGKNAIVWTGDGVFEEFVVQEVDGMLVRTDRHLTAEGTCHFDLDSQMNVSGHWPVFEPHMYYQ